MTDTRKTERWHIDKSIPLGILFGLVVQAAGVIWWAQGITKDVADHERRLAASEATQVGARLSTVESQVSDARLSLGRIEAKLDRVIERKGP